MRFDEKHRLGGAVCALLLNCVFRLAERHQWRRIIAEHNGDHQGRHVHRGMHHLKFPNVLGKMLNPKNAARKAPGCPRRKGTAHWGSPLGLCHPGPQTDRKHVASAGPLCNDVAQVVKLLPGVAGDKEKGGCRGGGRGKEPLFHSPPPPPPSSTFPLFGQAAPFLSHPLSKGWGSWGLPIERLSQPLWTKTTLKHLRLSDSDPDKVQSPASQALV